MPADAHRSLRQALVDLAGPAAADRPVGSAYSGSPHRLLGLSVPQLRRLARDWLAANKTMPAAEILAMLDRLFAGDIHDEKTLAALIVGYGKAARKNVTAERVDRWLDDLVGWAEVDALCYGAFGADDLLADWPLWGSWIDRLATDSNINKRRAALVLLTAPVKRSDDPRLAAKAFATVDRLKAERAILITKAVSWLLRSLVPRHRAELLAYLDAQRATLPAIAVREVTTKLATGRKTVRSQP